MDEYKGIYGCACDPILSLFLPLSLCICFSLKFIPTQTHAQAEGTNNNHFTGEKRGIFSHTTNGASTTLIFPPWGQITGVCFKSEIVWRLLLAIVPLERKRVSMELLFLHWTHVVVLGTFQATTTTWAIPAKVRKLPLNGDKLRYKRRQGDGQEG